MKSHNDQQAEVDAYLFRKSGNTPPKLFFVNISSFTGEETLKQLRLGRAPEHIG